MRPLTTVKLTECEVDIITYLTWGEKEDLRDILTSGAKIKNMGGKKEDIQIDYDPTVAADAKYALFHIAIKEIRIGEKKTTYTKAWLRDLSIADGDSLRSTVEAIDSGNVSAQAPTG